MNVEDVMVHIAEICGDYHHEGYDRVKEEVNKVIAEHYPNGDLSKLWDHALHHINRTDGFTAMDIIIIMQACKVLTGNVEPEYDNMAEIVGESIRH